VSLPAGLPRPELRFMWEAVHDRYARQADGTPVRTVTFTALSEAQRDALAGLLGRERLPDRTVTLRLEELDRLLLHSDAARTARQVAEAVCGPIVNRPAARRDSRQQLDRIWDELERAAGDRLAGWIRHLRTSGAATRAAHVARVPVDHLVGRALTIASLLPANGVALARLAEQATGDPHALDRGRPLRTLVLQAALQLAGEPPQIPAAAAAQRAILATVGVDADSVSTDVLVLGLRAVGDGPVDRLLNLAAEAGEPLRLTLRMLRGAPPTLDPGRRPLSVCENPSVVEAAADRLGAACAPVVCTDGMPTTAALRLLADAHRRGMTVRVSADFDAAGAHIANLLARRVGTMPWRYTADAYRQAIAAQAGRDPVRLTRRVPEVVFDPDLTVAMRNAGVAVFEEQQTDLLLGDLVPSR